MLLVCFSSLYSAVRQEIEIQLFNTLDYQESQSDYEFERTLLIYEASLPKQFNICLGLDSYTEDSDNDFNRTMYLKRANLAYHFHNLEIKGGLMVLDNFINQRKAWGHRYISKTFQNLNKFGENRGVGIAFRHKIFRNLQSNITVINGDITPEEKSKDYYTFQTSQIFQTEQWTLHLLNNITEKQEHTHAVFVNFQQKDYNLGLELVSDFNENSQDYLGASIFTNYRIYSKLMVFARLDMLDNSNGFRDTFKMCGLEAQIFKYFRSAFYYRHQSDIGDIFGLGIMVKLNFVWMGKIGRA